MNCEALCERLQTALQGNGKHGENLKSELNEVMQTILRRPSTKADLNYVVDLGPPAMLTLKIPVYEIELSSEFIPDAKGEGTRKEIEKSLASQAIEHFLLRLQLGELTLRDSPMPPAPGDPTGRGAEHHVFPTLQPGLQAGCLFRLHTKDVASQRNCCGGLWQFAMCGVLTEQSEHPLDIIPSKSLPCPLLLCRMGPEVWRTPPCPAAPKVLTITHKCTILCDSSTLRTVCWYRQVTHQRKRRGDTG